MKNIKKKTRKQKTKKQKLGDLHNQLKHARSALRRAKGGGDKAVQDAQRKVNDLESRIRKINSGK